MQIRYLEAMQAMAKSANSKVIFLPSPNQTMPGASAFNASLDAPNKYEEGESSGKSPFGDFAGGDQSFQHAMNAHVVEHI